MLHVTSVTPENIPHLLFTCCVAKVVWASVAHAIGACDVPNSITNAGDGLRNGYLKARSAAFCWATWKARNKACSEGKLLRNPVEIVCHACALIHFWAGLFAGEDKDVMIDGVNAMLKIAVKLLAKQSHKTGDVKRLRGSDQDDGGDPDSSK